MNFCDLEKKKFRNFRPFENNSFKFFLNNEFPFLVNSQELPSKTILFLYFLRRFVLSTTPSDKISDSLLFTFWNAIKFASDEYPCWIKYSTNAPSLYTEPYIYLCWHRILLVDKRVYETLGKLSVAIVPLNLLVFLFTLFSIISSYPLIDPQCIL